MKKSYKLGSLILALVMILSLAAVGFGASAAAASKYAASNGQSRLSGVSMTGTSFTGTANLWGWPTSLKVIEGDVLSQGAGATGTVVYSESWNSGAKPQAQNFTISGTVSGEGNYSGGYTVIVAAAASGAWAGAWIPYEGPTYEMKLQKDGTDIDSYTMGLNAGSVSGFKFIYENTCTYSLSNSNIEIQGTVDNFTIVPKAVGSTVITATSNGVSQEQFTITVTDDSSLSAQWFDTEEAITNNKAFTAKAGKAYGFGIDAFPPISNSDVVITGANTANATLSYSSVAGQFPYSIKATSVGSATVRITQGSKTLSFTVNFTDAAFDFFKDSGLDIVAEPMETVAVNGTLTLYTNKSVANWVVTGSGATYTTTATSITFTGVTADQILTVSARDASGAELQWIDIYVTGEAPVDPALILGVVKVGEDKWYVDSTTPPMLLDCGYATIIEDGKAFVPFRFGGELLGAEVIWDEPTQTAILRYGYFGYEYRFTIGSNVAKVYNLEGEYYPFFDMNLGESEVPFIRDGRTYLPARVLADTTRPLEGLGPNMFITYQNTANGDYLVYSYVAVPTSAQVAAVIARADAMFN